MNPFSSTPGNRAFSSFRWRFSAPSRRWINPAGPGKPEDKMHDAFLATDAIGTEKLVSGEYNTNVFMFGDSDLRKLMADIQVEEQNHAEMLYKYKTANGMQ